MRLIVRIIKKIHSYYFVLLRVFLYSKISLPFCFQLFIITFSCRKFCNRKALFCKHKHRTDFRSKIWSGPSRVGKPRIYSPRFFVSENCIHKESLSFIFLSTIITGVLVYETHKKIEFLHHRPIHSSAQPIESWGEFSMGNISCLDLTVKTQL